MSSAEIAIKNFAGLNLLDEGDKVADNELTLLQNVWQPKKGVLQGRWGSVADQSSFPLASRISGVWRHYAPNHERFTLYHCVPDSTLLPDNTVDLTLTDVADGQGNLFGGAAVTTVRVCYSWIGCGLEQTYNSKNRAGFPVTWPQNAWANPAHQTITLASNTSSLRVTVPAFPTGVRGANIFVSRGTSTQMTYMGSVVTSGGNILVRGFIGPNAAKNDTFTGILSAGTLVSLANTATDVQNYYQQFQSVLASLNLTYKGTDSNGSFTGNFLVASGTASGEDQLNSAVSQAMPALEAWRSAATAAAGQLALTTTYDCILVEVDGKSGLPVNVSPVFTGATSGAATALQLSLPIIGNGNSITIYFGAHGGPLYYLVSGITGSTYVINRTVAGGNTAPSANASGTPTIFGEVVNGANLQPGIYWVAFAWVCDPGIQEGNQQTTAIPVTYPQQITLSAENNSIGIFLPSAQSANGAKSVYVFVGTQDPTKHPMVCVGVGNVGGAFDITNIPAHNAQTSPYLYGPDANNPDFCHSVNDGWIGGVQYKMGQPCKSRFGFMMGFRQSSGVLQEIFPSRTLFHQTLLNINKLVYAGDSTDQAGFGQIQLHNWAPQPKTQNDLYSPVFGTPTFVQPFSWPNTPIDPSFCYLLGMTYFVNGADLPWQTDGYALGQVGCVKSANQTTLPPIGRYIFAYKQSLVLCGALAGNQLYASNANAPMNWASGGTGSLLRFVTVGDAVGSGITSMGIFTPRTEATSDPSSYVIGFKKNGCWMTQTISDPVQTTLAGLLTGNQQPSPMIQISGRVGCVSYRSIVNTPLGTLFLGQDGNIYLINSVSEPVRVGTKVHNALSHLVGNDSWMQMVTAVYHDNHYKLCYPSLAITKSGGAIYNDSELWADLRTGGLDIDEASPIRWMGPMQGRNIGAQVVLAGDQDDLSRVCADSSAVRTFTSDSMTALTDLGSPIVYKVKSKNFRFNKEGHVKRIMGAILDMYIDMGFSNGLLFEGFADSYYQQVNRQLSVAGGVWNSSSWDQANYADAGWMGFSYMFGPDNLAGRTFQWQITKSDPAPFVLSSVTLLLSSEKRRIIN